MARVTKGYVKPEREGLLYDTLPAIAISIAMEEGGNILQLGKKGGCQTVRVERRYYSGGD